MYRHKRKNRNKRRIIRYWNNLIDKNRSFSFCSRIFHSIKMIEHQPEHNITKSKIFKSEMIVNHRCGEVINRRMYSMLIHMVHTRQKRMNWEGDEHFGRNCTSFEMRNPTTNRFRWTKIEEDIVTIAGIFMHWDLIANRCVTRQLRNEFERNTRAIE